MTESEFDALWENLVDRHHAACSPSLTESEGYFFAVNLLRGAVPRSGFVGYFENSTGLDVLRAQQGLTEMGLNPVLELLQQAQTAAFGDSVISADGDYLEVIPTSLSEEEFMEESERIYGLLAPLADEFQQHDGAIFEALCAYADRYDLKPVGPRSTDTQSSNLPAS